MAFYSKPTPEQVDKAIALLASPEHCRVFFGKLENPEWVSPLRDRGCFSTPPVPVESGGGVAHPAWPASDYLAKMAPLAPQEVFSALDLIKTSNARVVSNMCEAAIALPPDLAEKLSGKILKAVKGRVWVQLYADKVADLIVRLAGSGRIDAACGLADAVFALEAREFMGHDPVGIIDEYHYAKILPKVMKALGEADASRAMQWAGNLLKAAASYHLSPETREEFDDVSHIWRPAIEDHEQNRGHDVADSIVTAVRDLAEHLVRARVLPLRKTVLALESKAKLVLSRMGLHLIRLFADQDVDLATEKMLTKELFNNYQYRHEYAMLLRDRFGMLKPDQQLTILGWIDEGPDRENTRKTLKANLGQEFKEEHVDRRVHIWQRDRLSWFRESLPPDWRPRYEALIAEFGQPEHADLPFWTQVGREGADPPKTAAELAAMDTPSLVEFLKTWRPDTKDFSGPSLADLASEFGSAVRENLERFAGEATVFAGLRPTYVTNLLRQVATAVQNERRVPIEPVVDLCLAVVRKPLGLLPEDRIEGDSPDSDPSWEYARNEVVTVVEQLCDRGAPLTLREKLWACLAPLETATDRSYITGEPEEDVRLVTWLDHACNNPKAEWINAVIRFALWVKKQTVVVTGRKESTIGLSCVPEAATLLEAYLRPDRQSSPAVRSVYGQRFPVLCWLDTEWARQHAGQIFTMTGEHSRHGWAAWNSYLVANRVYTGVFDVISAVYEQAVGQVEPSLKAKESRFHPPHSLAGHLVVLCGRGVLPVGRPEGLLQRFFRNAPTSVREHAIATVGRSLEGAEDLPKGVVERFIALWEWFWATFVTGQKNPSIEELGSFGWWLTCGKFEDQWCLNWLVQVTQLSPEVRPEQDVMRRLAELAQDFPLQVVTCADRMVRGDTAGWRLYGWQDHLMTLLGAVLHSDSQEAMEKAIRLVDHLGRRGFREFGRLVRGGSSPQDE